MAKTKTQLHIAAETHKGMERDHNEDNHIFCPDLSQSEWVFFEENKNIQLGDMGALLVVADGMGGYNAGEVASKIAVDSTKEYFIQKLDKKVLSDVKAIQSFMRQAIINANNAITSAQKEDKETEGMGTTIIMAWIYRDMVYVSWSGDSRCYVYNKERGLKVISKDHSFVQELVDKGKLTEEQAFFHPDSNVVTQSLGSESNPPKPDFTAYKLKPGDKIFLCSDGLNDMLKAEELKTLLDTYPSIDKLLSVLIENANQAGGLDNITVVMAEILKVDSKKAPYPKIAKPPQKKKKRKVWKTVMYLLLVALILAAGIFIGQKRGIIPPIYEIFNPGETVDTTSNTDESPEIKEESGNINVHIENNDSGTHPEIQNNRISQSKFDPIKKDPDDSGLRPAQLKSNEKWVYIDDNDSTILDNNGKYYHKAYEFHEGFAFVKFEKGWNIINTCGKKNVNPDRFGWNPISGFSNGIAKVKTSNDTIIIDTLGNRKNLIK